MNESVIQRGLTEDLKQTAHKTIVVLHMDYYFSIWLPHAKNILLVERAWSPYIHLPGWRSSTRGSTTCHIVGTSAFVLEDCIMVSYGVAILTIRSKFNIE